MKNETQESDNEEPKILQILPKAKFKKRVTRTSKIKTDDKQKRVRKKGKQKNFLF